MVAQQQMLRNFRAKRSKGTGRRKFKSAKRCLPSLNYTKRGFALKDGRLCLAGGLCIPVVWSRQLPAEPSSVRVYRDSIGHWYASFVVRRDARALPACDQSIGIDWGVRAVAITTDPEYDLPHPEHGRRTAKRLARRQRTMARRKQAPGQRGSKGYLGAWDQLPCSFARCAAWTRPSLISAMASGISLAVNLPPRPVGRPPKE